MTSVRLDKQELMNVEDLEFVAECRETEERVAFTMADLYGWDNETIFLDTAIFLNKPKEVNLAIVCKSDFGRRLNPEYNIHIRTEEERADYSRRYYLDENIFLVTGHTPTVKTIVWEAIGLEHIGMS